MEKHVDDQCKSSLSQKNTSPVLLSAPPHTWARKSIVVGHKEWDEGYDLCEK